MQKSKGLIYSGNSFLRSIKEKKYEKMFWLSKKDTTFAIPNRANKVR